eukprot:scaffold397620_cov23-Prasinocladus_malaysianus.AAC.1
MRAYVALELGTMNGDQLTVEAIANPMNGDKLTRTNMAIVLLSSQKTSSDERNAIGYVATGDVLVEGMSHPLGAIAVIRDDLHLSDGGLRTGQCLAEAPIVVRPTSYSLVWRTSAFILQAYSVHIHTSKA